MGRMDTTGATWSPGCCYPVVVASGITPLAGGPPTVAPRLDPWTSSTTASSRKLASTIRSFPVHVLSRAARYALLVFRADRK